jgi:phosphoribosylformylglycinamidine synthase
MGKIGVIQFPGTNCEHETVRALLPVGGDADVIRWNVSETVFHQYKGYILPGGFSYQDRVRSGAIAAKLPIISYLLQADLQEKPILGICNGCQILAESGLVPNKNQNYHIQMALTPNAKDQHLMGFICQWTMVKINHPEKSLFTKYFKSGDVLPIVMSHAEGKFFLSSDINVEMLTGFYYCNEAGDTVVASNGT